MRTETERVLLASVRVGAVLVLLMPLIVSEKTLFPFIVGKALYARGLIEITVGLWLVLAYLYPAHRPPRSWVLLAFGVWLGITVLAGLFGVSAQRSLWSTYERMQGIVDLAHWFAWALVVASVFRSMLDWRLLLNLNLGVSAVMALMGIAQHFEIDIPIFPFIKPTNRLDITLGNPTYVGAYMLVNVLIGLGFLSQSFFMAKPQARSTPTSVRRRRRRRTRAPIRGRSLFETSIFWWRLFWITATGLDSWVLVESGTRGAVIGLGIALLAFGLAYLKWGRLRIVRLVSIYLLAIVVIGGLVFALARDTAIVDKIGESNRLVARVANIGADDASITSRLGSMKAGFAGFVARPILGWGPENYAIAFGRHFEWDPGLTETFDQAHSKPLEELTTKGVLGLLSYFVLWAVMLWVVATKLRKPGDHEQLFTMFVGAALVGYFVQNLFLFDTPGTILQFVILLAFVVSLETTFEETAGEPTTGKRVGSGDTSKGGEEAEPAPSGRPWAGLGGLVSRSPAFERGRALGRMKVPRLGILAPFGLGVMLALILVGVIYNYRTYEAASAVIRTTNPSITWDQRLQHFERSVGSFSPLANYPRRILFGQVFNNWEFLSDSDVEGVMSTVDEQAREAIEAEPEGWRVYVALTHLYQRASQSDSKYRDQAETFLNKAIELAPDTVEVRALRERYLTE